MFWKNGSSFISFSNYFRESWKNELIISWIKEYYLLLPGFYEGYNITFNTRIGCGGVSGENPEIGDGDNGFGVSRFNPSFATKNFSSFEWINKEMIKQ